MANFQEAIPSVSARGAVQFYEARELPAIETAQLSVYVFCDLISLPRVYKQFPHIVNRVDISWKEQDFFKASYSWAKKYHPGLDINDFEKSFNRTYTDVVRSVSLDEEGHFYTKKMAQLAERYSPEMVKQFINACNHTLMIDLTIDAASDERNPHFPIFSYRPSNYLQHLNMLEDPQPPPVIPNMIHSAFLIKQLLINDSDMIDAQCGAAIVRNAIDPSLFKWFRDKQPPDASYYSSPLRAHALSFSYPLVDETGSIINNDWRDIHNLGIGLAFLRGFTEKARLAELYLRETGIQIPRPLLHVYVAKPLEDYLSNGQLPADVDGEAEYIQLLHRDICRKLTNPEKLKAEYDRRLPDGIKVDYQYAVKNFSLQEFFDLIENYLNRGMVIVPLLDWKIYDPGNQWRFKSSRHAIAIMGTDGNGQWKVYDPSRKGMQTIDANLIHASLWQGQFSVMGNIDNDENASHTNEQKDIKLEPFNPLAKMRRAVRQKIAELPQDMTGKFESYVNILDALPADALLKLLSEMTVALHPEIPALRSKKIISAHHDNLQAIQEPEFDRNVSPVPFSDKKSLIELYALASGVPVQTLLDRLKSIKLLYLSTDEYYRLAPELRRFDAGRLWVREHPLANAFIYMQRSYPLGKDKELRTSHVRHEDNGHLLLGYTMPISVRYGEKIVHLNASVILPTWFREGAANVVAKRYLKKTNGRITFFSPDVSVIMPTADQIIHKTFKESFYSYLESTVFTAYLLQRLGANFTEGRSSNSHDYPDYQMMLKGYFSLIYLANELARRNVVFTLPENSGNELGYDYLNFLYSEAKKTFGLELPSLSELCKNFDRDKDSFWSNWMKNLYAQKSRR